MDMDVKRVIEELETGGQDNVLMALQSYNKEVKLCAVNVLLLTSQLKQIWVKISSSDASSFQLLAQRTFSNSQNK